MELTGIVTDSRAVEAGSLFVALRGEHHDGHDYLDAAWAAGAAAVLVDRDTAAPAGRAVLAVRDTLLAYGELGAWWRRRFPRLRMVNITGSLGKTSTKALCAGVLASRFDTLASAASYNNEIGVPATLLRITPETEAAVLEVGMRGPGQIAYLARLTQPEVGVITNIGHSHLGMPGLGSRQAIAAAKGELLDELGPDGTAVLNADDEHLSTVARRHSGRVVWYGLGRGHEPPAEVRADAVVTEGLSGSHFRLVVGTESVEARLRIAGEHMVSNALAAAAVGHALGLSIAEIAAGLDTVRALPARGEVLTLASGARLINDCYNAAPESVRAALAVMKSEPVDGRRIAVLGGMLELGDVTEAEHVRLGRDAAQVVDVLVAVGELGVPIAAGAQAAGRAQVVTLADPRAAGEWLASQPRRGDLVLLKASRAVYLEEALQGLELTASAEAER